MPELVTRHTMHAAAAVRKKQAADGIDRNICVVQVWLLQPLLADRRRECGHLRPSAGRIPGAHLPFHPLLLQSVPSRITAVVLLRR